MASQAILDALQEWVAEMKDAGRVVTRYPKGLLAGQLASRLRVPDPSLGDTTFDQLDYRFAPLFVRAEDNWESLGQEIILMGEQLGGNVRDFVDDVVTGAGTVVHEGVKIVGSGLAAAIGIPPALLWLGIVAGVYYVVVNPGRARSYVRSWTGG